jgi:membrane protease YdiL (CAAX protease family)
MEKTKKNICILIVSIVCIAGITSLAGWIGYLSSPLLQSAAKVCLNLLNGLTAVLAMKLTGMKPEIDLRNKRQYLTGIELGLILAIFIAVIPALCGCSLVGGHIDFSIHLLIREFLFYMVIIGPVEELVFRVYLQDAFLSFFQKKKWAGVVLSSLFFGFWHIINGSIIQVPFAFCIGLVFGFAKYKNKNCGYVGVAVGHGFYDFLCTLTTMLIV